MNNNFIYWVSAIVIGTLINGVFFLLLPMINRTEVPKTPQIIELDFLAWPQPPKPIKEIKKEKTLKKKPIVKPMPKPSKKPNKKPNKKPKPKIKHPPKPMLSEKIIPEKKKVEVLKTTVIKEKITKKIFDKPIIESIEDVPIKDTIVDEVLPEPIPIFQLTQFPSMIHRQQPEYPSDMKQAGRDGTVKLEVYVDVTGKIKKITVIKSAGDSFDAAAIMAVQQSSFMPARVDGRAVNAMMKIPIKFRLR